MRIKTLVITSMLGLIPLVATPPAHASECRLSGQLCGRVYHYSPDAGLNTPILVRCNYGDPASDTVVYVGHWASCRDTDQVYVRAGEELWRNDPTSGTFFKWHDATGWYKINDLDTLLLVVHSD